MDLEHNHEHEVRINVDDDDVQMIIIDDDDDEEVLQLDISSPKLNKLRLFLEMTLQRLPSRLQKHIPTKFQQRVRIVLQLLIVVAISVHYFYTLGAFNDKTLVEEEMTLTLTTFKNVVWNLRHPIYGILGLLYFRSAHLDDFLSSLKLTSRSLKKAKLWLVVSIALVFVFSVLVPGGIRFMEMCYTPSGNKKKGFTPQSAILNTVFLIFARVFALPVVVIFIVVFAFLYFEICQYRNHIQTWSAERSSSARDVFVDIQSQIKKAERAFQPFLIVHIAILFLVFIPGIFGFIERVRSEGSYTHNYQTTPFTNNDELRDLLRLAANNTNANDIISATILIIKVPSATKIETNDVTSARTTKRLKNPVTNHKEKLPDRNAQRRIALEATAFMAETLSLYIPITLLGIINSALLRLPKTIGWLKFKVQQDEGYLFQSMKDVKDMFTDFAKAEGVLVLGMQLTVINTLLLGVVMPLFTLLIHIMAKHVDLKT